MSLTSPADDESYRDDEKEEEEDDGEDDTSDDSRCLCSIVLEISPILTDRTKKETQQPTHTQPFIVYLQHCKIDYSCASCAVKFLTASLSDHITALLTLINGNGFGSTMMVTVSTLLYRSSCWTLQLRLEFVSLRLAV